MSVLDESVEPLQPLVGDEESSTLPRFNGSEQSEQHLTKPWFVKLGVAALVAGAAVALWHFSPSLKSLAPGGTLKSYEDSEEWPKWSDEVDEGWDDGGNDVDDGFGSVELTRHESQTAYGYGSAPEAANATGIHASNDVYDEGHGSNAGRFFDGWPRNHPQGEEPTRRLAMEMARVLPALMMVGQMRRLPLRRLRPLPFTSILHCQQSGSISITIRLQIHWILRSNQAAVRTTSWFWGIGGKLVALAAANWQLQLACVPMSKSRSWEENIYFSSPLSGTTSIGQELPQKHGNEHGRNPTGFMIPVRLCTKFHGCLCTLAALAAFALDSLFPTCQMRVSRFHQMCFLLLLLLLPQQPRISTAMDLTQTPDRMPERMSNRMSD